MKADAQDSKNLFDVRNKVAFVTGASSGLGRHAANVLARSGASVVGIARRQEKLQDWVEENEGKVACEAHDRGDETQFERLAEKVLEHFGPPDILVSAPSVPTFVVSSGPSLSEKRICASLSISWFLKTKTEYFFSDSMIRVQSDSSN